jgi:hypothetical protein
MRHMVRSRVTFAGCVVASVLVLCGCSSTDDAAVAPARGSSVASNGLVTGDLPLCAGPSGYNLTPTLLVVASQDGQAKASAVLPSTSDAHRYQFSLPAGTYVLQAGTWPATTVDIQSGVTTVVDLPGGGCL